MERNLQWQKVKKKKKKKKKKKDMDPANILMKDVS